MIDLKRITEKAGRLRKLYGTGNIRDLISGLDLTLQEFPMGTGPDSIRAFILRNCRCATIMLNSDLIDDAVPFILAHEAGHYVMDHLQGASCAFQDRGFAYCRDDTDLARKENEATFFAAEYLLDTGETLDLLHEYDLMTAARIMKVPPEFLDFKARLMAGSQLAGHYKDCFQVRSDFLKYTPLGTDGDLIC